MQLEYNIYQKRNKHRRRRNLIRRIFLVLSVIVVIFFIFKIYSLQYKNKVEINVLNSSLVNSDYLENEIQQHIENKNFFLISMRHLSEKLIRSCNLLGDAVARKYIFPKYQLILFVVEKNIWAKVVSYDMSKDHVLSYVTDDGNLVNPSQVNVNLSPKHLTLLYLNNKKNVNANKYQSIGSAIKEIKKKYNLIVKQAIVTNDSELNVICDDLINEVEGVQIKAGRIDNELAQRINMLEQALEVIGDKGYLIEYIDLTLDNSIVFKESKNVDKPNLDKHRKKDFFKKKKY